MKELKGKWALVTGASSGIGADLARLYAKAGCHLIITARREQRLTELKKELSGQYDTQIEVIQNDLGTETGPQELFDAVEAKNIQVSILINNAGIALSGKFQDIPLDKKLGIIQLNLVSLTKLTHLFLQGMISRREGWIMQVASVYGFQPGPNMATYAATKAYVISLSEALNYELKTPKHPSKTSKKVLFINPSSNHKNNKNPQTSNRRHSRHATTRRHRIWARNLRFPHCPRQTNIKRRTATVRSKMLVRLPQFGHF